MKRCGAKAGRLPFEAVYQNMERRWEAKKLFRGIDGLVTPTVGRVHTCEELQADPIGANNNIEYYTYPVSPLGLCARSVPVATRADGLPFGVSLVGLAGEDGKLRGLGKNLEQ